jgi:hypothetical protein
MLRQGLRARAAIALAALAVVIAVAVVLSSGASEPSRAAVATRGSTTAAATYGPTPLARYKEGVPHVASALNVYAYQGQVRGAPSTPPDELGPVSPSAFRAPVAAYRTYSAGRLHLMQGEIAKLQAALQAGNRSAAQAAWRGAYAYYLPGVPIDPLDYATRAHEILEDAVRDQLSGTDAPWSGAGVLGTSAGLVATTEVVRTLAPVLGVREGVLPTVKADQSSLRSTLASIDSAHGGTEPTTSQLTQLQAEHLDGSLGQALEGLAQVPGALETTPTPVVPKIPASAVRIDP